MADELIETGLVAAAVTMRAEAAAEAAPPLPAVVPPSPAQMPDGWTLHKVAALVSDVAQNMYETPYLLKKHGLTSEQYATLQDNEFFKRALEAEIITWQGANSIQKRLALEAAIAVETSLPTVAARMNNSKENLADVVPLLKVLAEIAGIIGSKAAAPGASGEKFKIVINLGADTLEREATGSMEVQAHAGGESNTGTLQTLTKTPLSGPTLRALTEGN